MVKAPAGGDTGAKPIGLAPVAAQHSSPHPAPAPGPRDSTAIVQQAVGQLPWGHNLVLPTKLKTPEARLAHAARAIEHGWSRSVLVMRRARWRAKGKALTNFDQQLPMPQDAPTIGLLLCKSKNRIVAECALCDTNKLIGVAEYQLTESLPKDLEANLPSIKQIERELGETDE